METIAAKFKGLSDGTRLRILNLLKNEELCVCDLMHVMDMPQSTISRHLAYLRNSGWVESRRKGKWTYYRRPAAPTPFQSYAFTLLDEELSTVSQAVEDSDALLKRLIDKTKTGTMTC